MLTKKDDQELLEVKILPLKDAVLFPHSIIPTMIDGDVSIETIEKYAKEEKLIAAILLKNRESVVKRFSKKSFFTIGTLAKIIKIFKFPDNSIGVVLQGIQRFKLTKMLSSKKDNLSGLVEIIDDNKYNRYNNSILALSKTLKQLVQKAIALSPSIPDEAAAFVDNIQDLSYLSYLVMPYLNINPSDKQELLEVQNLKERLERIHQYLVKELEILEMSKKIHHQVQSEISKQQRKYYVREQIKLLQKEIFELEGKTISTNGLEGEIADFVKKIEKTTMPKSAKEAAVKEIDKLKSMQVGSPEYTVSVNYLNWIFDIPWEVYTKDVLDINKAKKNLDSNHFGLDKIKERILELLAVYSLNKKLDGSIIVFVGPPGVGKTSLGKSIADSLGRKFARISLGGLQDESEIRGHRRTYIGSMPGKIVSALKKVGSMNPVIVLDEIDKISIGSRSDPSGALLEVLDPEQNDNFVDNYLDVSIDLSKVLFICTANTLQSIPYPLLDRMEIIDITGYTLQEKIEIAKEHLIPKVLEKIGLNKLLDFEFKDKDIGNIIQNYTRESGVRELSRKLFHVFRSVTKTLMSKGSLKPDNKEKIKYKIDDKKIKNILGPEIYLYASKPKKLNIGVSTGLAYTSTGGDVLFIETALSYAKNFNLTITGQLGSVMKESVHAAFSYIKSNMEEYKIDKKVFEQKELHVHFPAGATPKDGPSAGVAIFLAILSRFSNKSVSSDIAVTGEISLRGDVLPVGGIKEKLIAAYRHGIKLSIIPYSNKKDLVDIPKEVKKNIDIKPVKNIDEVYKIVF